MLADISQTDPRRYPSTTVLLASPECTNHSLSKGVKRKGQAQLGLWEQKPPDPAEERSRCTMWDPLRFAEYHHYPIIIIENVVDARYWRLWEAWLHGWQALDWPPNVWIGVSIESDRFVARADALRMVPAPVRFLSCEPLLGPLPSLALDGISWLVIGGESGPQARPMELSWVRDLIARGRERGIAVFVKQMGTVWARQHGERGKGSDMTSWDADLRVREYPTPLLQGANDALVSHPPR